jgi:RimJ/RimL family protein N-acetyltransferase
MRALEAGDLVLEPLAVGHADAMYEVLSDPALYRYLDYGPPPSVEHLRSVYARLETRRSPDGSQLWLNWVVRPKDGPPLGYVQATVAANHTAWIAYVFSSRHWGRGHGTLATRAVVDHLASDYEVTLFLATVEAENERSIRLLERLGFHPATPQEAAIQALSATERLFVCHGPGSAGAPESRRGGDGRVN